MAEPNANERKKIRFALEPSGSSGVLFLIQGFIGVWLCDLKLWFIKWLDLCCVWIWTVNPYVDTILVSILVAHKWRTSPDMEGKIPMNQIHSLPPGIYLLWIKSADYNFFKNLLRYRWPIFECRFNRPSWFYEFLHNFLYFKVKSFIYFGAYWRTMIVSYKSLLSIQSTLYTCK